jgi:hypothetical protein
VNETLRLEITAQNSQAITSLEQVKGKLEGVSNSVGPVSQKLGQFTAGTNQAAFALTNLGRVAQDAPFGFIGIQNNLNPLLESFQRLKVETGSTSAAMKALGSSLLGAGGIGFALSVASSLFLVFGDSIFAAGKSAKKTEDELKDLTDSIVQDVAQVRLLVAEYNKSNTSQKERKEIIKELQTIAPQYFADLNAEKTTFQELEKAVNAYNGSIANQIRAKLLTKDLEELIKQEEALKKLVVLQEDFNLKMKTGRTSTDAQEKLNKLLEQEAKLQERINGLVKPTKRAGQEEKPVYGPAEYLFAKNTKVTDPRERQRTRIDLGEVNAPQSVDGGRNKEVLDMIEQSKQTDVLINKEKALNEELKKSALFTDAMASFADQFANSITSAIDAGQSMGEVLSNVYKQLVKDIEKAIIKQTILTALMAVTGGASGSLGSILGGAGGTDGKGGGFFAGIIKSIFGKGKADGGLASGPKSGYLELLHGDEMVIPMNKMGKFVDHAMGLGAKMGGSMGGPQMVYVEGKISGNDIILAQRRADFSLNVRR